MSKEDYDNFFKRFGPGVHTDPVRFKKIASLCKGSVLDIGCGTGDLADFYQEEYAGIDISEVAVNYAKELRRKTATFLVGNPVDIYCDLMNQFDTIVMAQFLEHLKTENKLWANIVRWSKPNTRLIISVPNGARVPDESHERIFTVPELRKIFSQMGKVKFHNWHGFKERIILTVDLGEKNENLLSLTMIVKNEEKGLEKSILSTIEFVDTVVISVDKNSTDKTLEIAKLYADTLKQYEWKNDFSAARNFCQEGINTKWCLILDGHEYVESCPNLEKALESDCDGLMTSTKMEDGMVLLQLRFIKPSVKWAMPVHNYPDTENVKQYQEFMVIHDRLSLQEKSGITERDKQRHEMIFSIMADKVKKDKKDFRSHFYLANTYSAMNNLKKAISHYKIYLKYGKLKDERWLVWYYLADCYNKLGKPKKALKYLLRADKEMPQRWETKKRIGAILMMLRKYRKALTYLVDSNVENKGFIVYKPEVRNDAQTWFFISQCFLELKEYLKTKIAARIALKLNKKAKGKLLPKDQVEALETIIQA